MDYSQLQKDSASQLVKDALVVEEEHLHSLPTTIETLEERAAKIIAEKRRKQREEMQRIECLQEQLKTPLRVEMKVRRYKLRRSNSTSELYHVASTPQHCFAGFDAHILLKPEEKK